jgi:hypothetical protein
MKIKWSYQLKLNLLFMKRTDNHKGWELGFGRLNYVPVRSGFAKQYFSVENMLFKIV